jgi:hypothetical protein
MAAPTTTVRQTPGGIQLPEGFSSKIASAVDPDVSFWELSVAGGGLDAGDEIEQTTMHNVAVRTYAPRSLYRQTPLTITAAYDPAVFTQIKALIGVEGSWTRYFTDGSTLDFFGFLKTFDFEEDGIDGNLPTATIEIVPTNYDPVNHVEAVPVLTSVSGT